MQLISATRLFAEKDVAAHYQLEHIANTFARLDRFRCNFVDGLSIRETHFASGRERKQFGRQGSCELLTVFGEQSPKFDIICKSHSAG
jgi:hypothetical protein